MSSLLEEVEAVAERVFERKFSQLARTSLETECVDPKASELHRKLDCINAKEHISTSEAALLLNCSDGHIRNLVGKARKRRTDRPIPFTDLDGVTVFNRLALLAWANTPKHKFTVISSNRTA